MKHQQPPSTFASRQLAHVLPIVGVHSRLGSWALALTMAATTLLFRAIVSPAAGTTLLYLLPATHAVWFLGGRAGMALTIPTVIAGGIVAGLVTHDAAPGALVMQVWNVISDLLSVGLIGFVLTGLHSALAIERWRASTDQLTGALNRAAFEERSALVIARAEAAGEALILAYMDLDGFKNVNDRHGHAAGNLVLAAFADAAQAAIRSTDTFARIGGDEFVALLQVPSALDGDYVAELLHKRLRDILAATGYAVTCSMGALVMEARQMAREDAIIEQADRLMYLAKQSGKNAVNIGRGEALAELLRAAFPLEPAPLAMQGMLQWIDNADCAAPDRKRA